MAQKKAYEVDAWLARPSADVVLVLVYGPDRGLVAERARAFAATTKLPPDDPFSVVRLDAAEVDADSGRLVDEAHTVPMFSERRLLWVRNAGLQKGLADQVRILCAEPPRDALVLIEAGDLKKGAALRTVVEAAPRAMALPCYADEARDLDAVIDDELRKSGLSLSLDARQALRRNLGGDRLASRGEIQKLALYAHGRGEISLADVNALTGDVSGSSFDDAIDAMLVGNRAELDDVFSRYVSGGGQIFPVLAAATRQLQALEMMRTAMEADGRGASAVVAAARPPVFFSRRKLVERALDLWTSTSLERALARLHFAVLQTRKRPDLAVAITRNVLLGAAIEAARTQRSRD